MSKFNHGDIIHKSATATRGERIMFVDRELQPGFYLGVLLEDDFGRFYTATVEKEDGYELVAEGVGEELVAMIRKNIEENPGPPPDPEKMRVLMEDLKAFGFIK